jgi:hypothetical protein
MNMYQYGEHMANKKRDETQLFQITVQSTKQR